MTDSEKRPHCYEGASRLEHDLAPRALGASASLAAAVVAAAAKVRRALSIASNRRLLEPRSHDTIDETIERRRR